MCMYTEPWTETDLRSALDLYEADLRALGKAQNTVNVYVQHSDRFIDWLVGRYQPRPVGRQDSAGTPTSRTSRYDPLHDHLVAHGDHAIIHMTFAEIETIIGRDSLPQHGGIGHGGLTNSRAPTFTHTPG